MTEPVEEPESAPAYDLNAVVRILSALKSVPPNQQIDTLATACDAWIKWREKQASDRGYAEGRRDYEGVAETESDKQLGEAVRMLQRFGHEVAGAAGLISNREVVENGCRFWYEEALPWLQAHPGHGGCLTAGGPRKVADDAWGEG